MKYQYILFDLDGTLSNPKEGITKCVQYALKDQGIIEDHLDKLTPFIGPPLLESFMRFYGMSEENAKRATIKYRERFQPIGYLENIIFDDTIESLERLKKYGYQLAIATSKPEYLALMIIEHFQIKDYFTVIKGASETRNEKDEVIEDCLAELGNVKLSECLMVGDRKHDIIGAKKNHIDVAALHCGFAPEGEFETYQPNYIFNNLTELTDFLVGDK